MTETLHDKPVLTLAEAARTARAVCLAAERERQEAVAGLIIEVRAMIRRLDADRRTNAEISIRSALARCEELGL